MQLSFLAHTLLLVALLVLGAGCASPLLSLVGENRLPEAWRAACELRSDAAREQRSGSGQDSDGLDATERVAIRQAVMSQTRGTFVARALSREALHRRLGGPVFATDLLLLMTHSELTSYPGSGVTVTPRFVVRGRLFRGQTAGTDSWKLAGIERPTEGYGPSLKPFNKLGAVADLFIAGVTLGMMDANLRGQKDVIEPGKPGTPGTGTDLQQQALFQIENAESATKNYERLYGGGGPGSLIEPYDVIYLVHEQRERPHPHQDALSLDATPPQPAQDSLILRLRHTADRVSNAWCNFEYDLVVPLPAGDDLASRINSLFAKGPIALGAR